MLPTCWRDDISLLLSSNLWRFTWTSSYAPRIILGGWHTEKRTTFHFFSSPLHEDLPGLAHMLPEWSWEADTQWRGRHSISSLLFLWGFTWTSSYAPRIILFGWHTVKRTTFHSFSPPRRFTWTSSYALRMILGGWHRVKRRHSIPSFLHPMKIYLDLLICSQNDLEWLRQGEEDDIPFLFSSTFCRFTWISSYAPRMILGGWHKVKRTTFHFFSPLPYEDLPGLAHMLPEWSWAADTRWRGWQFQKGQTASFPNK